jgi:sugar-specific transcriptional regulator TrmB
MNGTNPDGPRGQSDRLGLAISLGLSPYEARAFLVLLERGESKASQVAMASRIPRGRIYEVLESLHAKGLVSVVPAKPLRYRSVALKAFIERRREDLRAAEDDLERSASRLIASVTPRPTPSPTGEFLLFRKRQVVARKFREMVESARKEVLVSASEMCVVRGSRLFIDAYRERAKAGVATRVSTRITPQNRSAVEVIRAEVDVRHTDLGNRGTSILVVDGSEVFICHWNPDDEDLHFGDDVGLWSTNPGVVESFHTIVADAWDRGIPAEVSLSETEVRDQPDVSHASSPDLPAPKSQRE